MQRSERELDLIYPSTAVGLIHKAYLAEKNGTAFEIWGSGKPLRQFIYSLDLVSSYLISVVL